MKTKLLSIILIITLTSCTSFTYAVEKSTKLHRVGGESRVVCVNAAPVVKESTLASLMPSSAGALPDTILDEQWYKDIDPVLSALRVDLKGEGLLDQVRDSIKELRARIEQDPAVLRHPDLLFSLNYALNNIRRERRLWEVSQKKCLSDVRALMKMICRDPALSAELAKGLVYFEGFDTGTAEFTFYDETSTSFLAARFPELVAILNDSAKAQAFVLLLGMVRLAYPHYYLPRDRRYEMLTPLEYAIESKTYVALGNGLYVAPLSESFRRHIIFTMDAHGRPADAVEIFLPGQNYEKWVEYGGFYIGRKPGVDTNRFAVGCEMFRKYGQDKGFIKPHCLAEYPAIRTMTVYGEQYDLAEGQMFRVIIFDHSPAVQGRRILNDAEQEYNIYGDYVERIAAHHPEIHAGGTEYSALSRSITVQTLRIVRAFLNERYTFNDGESHDFHMGNFRLTPAGKVFAVGDFTTFEKLKDDSVQYDLSTYPERLYLHISLRRAFDVPWAKPLPDLTGLEYQVKREKLFPSGRGTQATPLRAA